MKWYKIGSYRMYLERLPNASVEVFDCWARITGADLYTWENPNDLIRYLQCGGHGYHFNPERTTMYGSRKAIQKFAIRRSLVYISAL